MDGEELRAALDRDGYAWLRGALTPAQVRAVRDAFAALPRSQAVRRRGGAAFGVRNALALAPAAAEVLAAPGLVEALAAVLGAAPAPVKATLFDKMPGANWNVGWHQDVTIALRGRREVPGFTAWSVKAGVPHAQPPVAILEAMLAARVHLDPCAPENGPLRVIPGSHRHGRLDAAAERRRVAEGTPVVCAAAAGDILLLRPLLLHASPPAAVPTHRRVLHLEFPGSALPGGLEWARALPDDGGATGAVRRGTRPAGRPRPHPACARPAS